MGGKTDCGVGKQFKFANFFVNDAFAQPGGVQNPGFDQAVELIALS